MLLQHAQDAVDRALRHPDFARHRADAPFRLFRSEEHQNAEGLVENLDLRFGHGALRECGTPEAQS